MSSIDSSLAPEQAQPEEQTMSTSAQQDTAPYTPQSTTSDLPEPKPGLFNSIDDYTEEEVRRVQTSGFMPDDRELAEDMYALDTLSKKLSKKQHDDEDRIGGDDDEEEDDKDHGTSSQDTAKAAGGPPGGSPGGKDRVPIWHSSMGGLRTKVAVNFVKVWVILACLVIVSFSIYWGSLYDRTGHMRGLKMIVAIEDDDISGVSPTIGDVIEELLTTTYEPKGSWRILRGSEEINDFFGEGKNVSEELLREVHHRHYWSATHVYPNATQNQLEFYRGNSDSAGYAVQFMYETGRDPVAMTPYVVSTLKSVQSSYLESYNGNITQQLISQLSDDEKLTLIESQAISTPPVFNYLDYRPFEDYTIIAPIQVGLIYLIIMSFFLFNFFAQTHLILLPHIKIHHYILYRLLGNHLSYLILSLFVCAVSAIFQIDFQLAFGKGGFVVLWLSTYLTMAAVGGANENMGMILFAYNPPFLGFWLISFVILNVSPSFSPMALTSHFYRYGYMMPIHHANEIFKVILLDLWKGQLGMNYGVLVAWIVVNSLLLPLVLRHVGTVMANKARAAAIKAAEEKEKGNAQH